MSAFPPIRSRQSIPVSATEALLRLQSYLDAAQTNPALLPNTTLQPDGPRSQTESASNLTIHNLKRVEAGLRGEWLAPTLELETEAMLGLNSFPTNANTDTAAEDGDGGEGWQDLDEYQREQSVQVGEVGPRETLIRQEGDNDMEIDDEAVEQTASVLHELSPALDKAARKREKRYKQQREKMNRYKKVGKIA